MSKSRFDQPVSPVLQQAEEAHGVRSHDLYLVALDHEGVRRRLQRLPDLVRDPATVVDQGVPSDASQIDVRVVPALVRTAASNSATISFRKPARPNTR